MAAEKQTPQKESLVAVQPLRVTDSEDNDIRFLGIVHDKTNSEIMRRYFDFERMRSDAAEARAIQERVRTEMQQTAKTAATA